MKRLRWLLMPALAATGLAGCVSTVKGPAPVISRAGPEAMDGQGLVAKFTAAATAAAAPGASLDAQHAMMKSGYALIYANCSDFFTTAGQSQKWIIFTRDTVGALGTLATGIMALHNASKNAVANVGFVTAATFTGLDIYTKNFLFSAENVDSVRQLVLKALVAHENAVGEHDDDSYESVTLALLDNQDICMPMSIAALAKEAIKNGHVVAAGTIADDLKVVTAAQDQAVLEGLGKLLHPPGPLTLSQAAGLWWLLREPNTPDQRKGVIAKTLAGLDADKSPLDANGAYKNDWALLVPVNSLLTNFSTGTQDALKASVAKASEPPATDGSGNTPEKAGAIVKVPTPHLPAYRRRVTITVQ